jgi:hypothetical protein
MLIFAIRTFFYTYDVKEISTKKKGISLLMRKLFDECCAASVCDVHHELIVIKVPMLAS